MICQITTDPFDPYIIDSGIVKNHLRDILRRNISAVPDSAVRPKRVLHIPGSKHTDQRTNQHQYIGCIIKIIWHSIPSFFSLTATYSTIIFPG